MDANAGPIPMTYQPKFDAVFSGECTQTIRKGSKYHVGERRWVFEWQGEPRRSKWGRRVLVSIFDVWDITALAAGVVEGEERWPWLCLDELAAADGIEPPTGEALRETLKRLNGENWEGEYQIVRWRVLVPCKTEGGTNEG